MMTRIFLAITTAFLLTSCFEQSIVIQVNKDGSGIVHERIFAGTDMGEMMEGFAEGMAEGIGEGLGGEMTPKERKKLERELKEGFEEDGGVMETFKPRKKDLKKRATTMGEGVTFESLTASTNEAGWDGWEIIFAFEDINQLSYDLNEVNSSMNIEGLEEVIEKAKKEADEELLTFTMADGNLTVHLPEGPEIVEAPQEKKGKKKKEGEAVVVVEPEGGAEDPFGDLPVVENDENNPAAFMMGIMGSMFDGMKVGVFVETTDDIAETNASHQNENMVTLMLLDMAKMMSNPAAFAKLESMEDEQSFGELRVIAQTIPGLTVEPKQEVTIKVK